MPKIITLNQIKQALKDLKLILGIDDGSVAYFQGGVVPAGRRDALRWAQGDVHEVTKPRAPDGGITVADLTGVAVQDIQIAKAVWRRLG